MEKVEGGEETLLSPKNRVKLLCSHGGKILPRPPDGQLKYVGGETRVFAFPRDINFSELMKKLTTMSNGDMVLKYQLIPDDLETLVSVKCDEDLHHMLAEYDRHYEEKSTEDGGSPRLRAFLFPSNPPITQENQTSPNIITDDHVLQQTYIDAINGVIRTPPTIYLKGTSRNISRSTLNIASAGSSPKCIDTINQDGSKGSFLIKEIPKVSSSPSLYNLGHNHPNYNQQQPYYQQPQKLHGPRLMSVLSMGRNEIGRYHVGNMHPLPSRPKRRSGGGCICCEQSSRSYGSGGPEMVDNLPQSSMKATGE